MMGEGQRCDRKRLAQDLKLYAITDGTWLAGRPLIDVVREVLDGGATFIQYREKHATHEERVAAARPLCALCHDYGVPFVVNDDVACALEVEADGVHVGQSDMSCLRARQMLGPQAIIGVSAQTPAQALCACRDGADYLGVGAVFSTQTKRDADDVGLEGLRQVCAVSDVPVVAIGGIQKANVSQLAGSGIAGVAVISALFGAPCPGVATSEMRALVESMLAVPDGLTGGMRR